ncbi:MAG: 3-isopropylmalate dehydratase small subunit [Thermoplasmata archaeon]
MNSHRKAGDKETPMGNSLRVLRAVGGRAVVLGDDVNTDLIIAGRYCRMAEPAELARHVLEGTEWEGKVSPGDIIIAGRNMGIGSSREQAPLALKGAGVRAIVAESFGRIFFRNSVNIGLPVMVVPGVRGRVRSGERVLLDFEKGTLEVPAERLVLHGEPLPPFMTEILRDGGLVPHLRRRMGFWTRSGGARALEKRRGNRAEFTTTHPVPGLTRDAGDHSHGGA